MSVLVRLLSWLVLRPAPEPTPAPIAAPEPSYELPEGVIYDDGITYRGWVAMDGEAFVPMPDHPVS